MDSNYHIFKKKITTNKKTTHKWYYFWNDPVTGKMYQRVCKGCKTQAEAYAFVSALPPLFVEEKITIAKIAEWMYVPGGPHLERLAKLGIVYSPETISNKRHKLNIIVEEFGNLEVQDLTIPLITDYLIADSRSGSWKNGFLTVIGELYSNAPFCGTPYIPIPAFPKFRRNSKKKDIFTTEELNIFFNERLWLEHSETKYQNFPQFDEGHKAMYLLFLCCVKLGLRIGEGIGIRTNQFLFDERAFVVDGFWKANQLYYKRRAKRDMGALKEGQRAFKRGHKIQKTDIVKRQAFGPDFFCRRSKHAGLSVYFKNALSARIKFP